jgi:hypothetical protein
MNKSEPMPVTLGYVGKTEVQALRDSGCSGIVVWQDLVHEDQYLGYNEECRLIDNSVIQTPMARICIDTPHYTGDVVAMVMKRPIYDLVIGNIIGVRNVEDPDPDWKQQVRIQQDVVVGDSNQSMTSTPEIAVITRAGSKQLDKVLKPLNVVTPKLSDTVNVQNLIKWQLDDDTLNKVRKQTDHLKKNDNVRWFGNENGILYRYFQSPKVNGGDLVKQVVVPNCLRRHVMMIGHDSVLAGHMGVRKTIDRIQIAFYWPGMDGDVRRYCKSCDMCQRTIPKGKVTKIPLGSMPRIEVPFTRVGIDLIGPITPKSDRGHRYIVTVVDYATRYPEAAPLKNITTEEVAEALFKIYCRIGFPKQVLTDLGTQFTSSVMVEVNRLMSIKMLNSTPYHPICNGLVEKWNGTLKSMLRKFTVEKPQDWDRYLDPILFAYREVPQESTGYSPFELVYGRSVRGPMSILKECWTNENVEQEVKSNYDYVIDLKNRISETCELAQTHLMKSRSRYKRMYDRKARERKYKVDDKVLILLPTSHNKLLLQWKGPFVVTVYQ